MTTAKWNTQIELPANPATAMEAATKQYVDTGLATKAPLNNAALTGVPTAPTAAAGTNTTQLATTAFVRGELSAWNSFTGNVTLAGDLLPDADNVRSLGSPTLMWKDVYIGPGSLYLNGQKILEDTESGTIRMTADANQNIAIQTQGTGDVELNPLGTGVIQLKGNIIIDGGALVRASDGLSILFDDSIEFLPGAGITGGLNIDGNAAWHAGNFTPANKLDVSAYTAADVLTKIKTLDGAGSGLDADLFDGLDSTSFLRKDAGGQTFGTGVTNQDIILTIANPGVGYANGFTFSRTSDGAGIHVTEYASDSTLYEMWMYDNPDTATDIFSWRYQDWQGLNGTYQPLQIANKQTRFIGTDARFYAPINQSTGAFFTTADPSKTNNTKYINYINDYAKLKLSGTGTVTITNIDLTNYSGTNGNVMWIVLTASNTFEWGYGRCDALRTAVETGLAVSTTGTTLLNGAVITFSSIATGVAGDTFQWRSYRKPTTTLSNTTIAGTFDVSQNANFQSTMAVTGDATFSGAVVINKYSGGIKFNAFNGGLFYAHGPSGAGDNVFSLTRIGSSSYDFNVYGRLLASNNEVWHGGNFTPSSKLDASAYTAADVLTKIKTVDGDASGLDADLLDGQEGSYYRNATNINAGTLDKARLPTLVKGDVGLGNVDNTADIDKPISTATATALAAKLDASQVGAANGVAPLGADAKIPASFLPSYVDDVLEYANQAAFPATGEAGKIYVALDTNDQFRWGGTVYVEISASPGSTDAVAEGSTNLYFTDARARAAIIGAASTVVGSDLSANYVLVSDADGKIGVSAISTTVLGYLSGVTSDIQTQLGTKLNSSAYTAADVLTKIKTVDGAASGLDADLLDGQEGSYYRDASNLNAGTVAAARLPAFTGDVTAVAGTAALTIANGVVGLSKMAALAANSIIGNNTGGSATPVALTTAQVKTMLALTKSDVGLANVDNTSDANKPISTATQTALNDKVSIAATHLGKVGSVSYDDVTNTAALWANLPVGYSRMMHGSTIGLAGGAPATSYGYFHKVANRDFQSGWAGIWIGHGGTHSYIGVAADNTVTATWQKIWTDANDGAASGLDADLLDGQQGSYYQNATNLNAGTLADGRLSGNVPLKNASNTFSGLQSISRNTATTATDYLNLIPTDYATGKPLMFLKKEATATTWSIGLWDGTNNAGTIDIIAGTFTKQGNTIWHAGNDGAGSGLDADLLDGNQGSFYQNADNINAGTLAKARLPALVKADVGLGNVDNTSDLNKPISTATQTALDLKADQSALAAKADANNAALTGTPTAPTAAPGTNSTQLATTAFVQEAVAALEAGVIWTVINAASVDPAVHNTCYVMVTGGTLRQVTLPSVVPQGFYVMVKAVGANVRIVMNGHSLTGLGAGDDLLLDTGSSVALFARAAGVLEIVSSMILA